MITYLKNFFLYSGLTKEQNNNIIGMIREENRKNAVAFSLLATVAFLFAGILQVDKSIGVGYQKMFAVALMFALLAIVGATISKKAPAFGTFIAYIYMILLLSAGIYTGVQQPTERTTLLLVFFIFTAVMFCPQLYLCILINTGAEIIYLLAIYQTQEANVRAANTINSLIFCAAGQFASAYLLKIRYTKYQCDYENKLLIERDALTMLYNRHSYEEELEKIRNGNTPVAICACDINQLKFINDTRGHIAGDELITGAAACISEVVGDKGKVFRVGGDEFIALLYSGYEKEEEILQAIKFAAKNWRGEYVEGINISCGIALLQEDYANQISEALKKADELMYEDKRKFYEVNKIERRRGNL